MNDRGMAIPAWAGSFAGTTLQSGERDWGDGCASRLAGLSSGRASR